MSRRVEIIREQFAAFNAGDVGAMLDNMAQDAVVETDPVFPEGGTFTGHDQIERFMRGLREGWRDPVGLADDFKEVGDQVLLRGEWRGTGEASGIEVTSDWSVLYTFRGDTIVSLRWFFDRAEALEAAGLTD
jgi:ketosteroid isomerase-like protein